jgi:hypothetical protein
MGRGSVEDTDVMMISAFGCGRGPFLLEEAKQGA